VVKKTHKRTAKRSPKKTLAGVGMIKEVFETNVMSHAAVATRGQLAQHWTPSKHSGTKIPKAIKPA
jgi:Zn-dependent membrane protease YugP